MGTYYEYTEIVCHTCHGAGKVHHPKSPTGYYTCPTCEGTKKIWNLNPCDEISQAEMADIICSHSIQDGGMPHFLFDEAYLPVLDSLQKKLSKFGIRIVYMRTEEKE